MLEKKIKLNNAIRKLIYENRKSAKNNRPELSADYISTKIGRSKSWLSQVENGRLQSVKTEDLINVYTLINNTDYKHAKEYVDDRINFIYAEIKNNITDEDGNIIDFADFLIFQQTRGHLQYATRKFNQYIDELNSKTSLDIKNDLKSTINHWLKSVVYWINKAFPDTDTLFSDEISLINLYLIVESSYKILDKHYDYHGLNAPNITVEDLQALKNKLNDKTVFIPRTEIKPLNEYNGYELDKVIKYYKTEDYLSWKHHGVYLGNEPFPLLVNYRFSPSDRDCFKFYKDITTQSGLSEKQYLHIIKQLCYLLDTIYGNCKAYLNSSIEYEEDVHSLLTKVKQLEEENKTLKLKIEELKNNNLPD